ncbi:MAG: glycosyltransferase [Fretibacterium sp.]|nr:glycosyltransferase [Fretibacterium sp.]
MEHVQAILGIESQDFELVVSNNGSVFGKENYEQIKNIQNPKLHYSEFKKNQGFLANICQVIKMSRGDFCMLLSDEDSVIAENLPVYLDIIRHSQKFTGDLFGNMWTAIGVIFGSTSDFQYQDSSAAAGEASLKTAYMWGNYISGLFFNRQVITDQVVDKMLARYAGNTAWIDYPHMFFVNIGIIKGGVVMCSRPIVRIDTPEVLKESTGKTYIDGQDFSVPLQYIAWEVRLAQMKGFCQQIKDLDVSNDLKFWMFCAVCNKTLFLHQVAKSLYLQNDVPWEKALLALVRGMLDYLDEVDITVVSRRRKLVERHIIELAYKINGVTIPYPLDKAK